MATHYEVLGVPPTATHDEIRRAYYRQARRHHPDAHTQSSDAVQSSARRLMVTINASWAVLGDPDRRRAYDDELAPRPRSSTSAATAGDADDAADLAGFPDWFEPDNDVPAYRLAEDHDDGVRGPVDLLVFVPVGLLALAVVCFALGMVVQWPALFSVAFLLVPLALVGFLAAPFVVMATRVRSRPDLD